MENGVYKSSLGPRMIHEPRVKRALQECGSETGTAQERAQVMEMGTVRKDTHWLRDSTAQTERRPTATYATRNPRAKGKKTV